MSMETMTIDDFARVLADRKKLEPSVARLFVATMFDVVRQALGTERTVKVKGLGTFKLVEVSARESVSVNTGGRVLIGSHDKITFTPDSLMRELVNKPFSQFETVVLNDGVEFGDIEAEKAADVAEPEISPDLAEPEADGLESEAQPSDEDVCGPEEVAEAVVSASADVVETADDIIGRQSGATVADAGAALDSAPEGVPQDTEQTDLSSGVLVSSSVPAVAEDMQAYQTPEAAAETPSEEDVAELGTAAHVVAENASIDAADAETPAQADFDGSDAAGEASVAGNTGGTGRFVRWLVLCVVVAGLMAGSAYVGFLYGKYMPGGSSETSETAVSAGQQTVEKPAAVQTAPADTTAAPVPADTASRPAAESAPKTAGVENKAAESPAEKPEQGKTSPEPFDYKKYERMDRRILHGAYDIVGTDKVVTVKSGQTLGDISDRHLGPGMECYVETYNGLGGDVRLKAGQKLKIPKLRLKKRRPH